MTIKKSKAMYLFVLLGCIGLALADMQYNERKALVYHIQAGDPSALMADQNELFNQNIITDEEDNSFYSMLVPCD